MLYVSGIMMIAKNAGMPSVRSAKSIFVILCSIKKPTSTSAGAVAKTGIAENSGEKNNAIVKSTETDNAVSPVFPPTAMPAALSMYVVTVDVPSTAPTTVPAASDKNTCFMRGSFPSLSISSAFSDRPMIAPIVSNTSTNKNANIITINSKIPTPKPELTCLRAENTVNPVTGGGSEKKPEGIRECIPASASTTYRPVSWQIMPASHVNIIPHSSAPLTFKLNSAIVITTPARVRTTVMLLKSPGVTGASGIFATTTPPLTRPINEINRPIPAPTASFRFFGIASNMASRTLRSESIINSTPSTNTAISAICQPNVRPIVNAKNALIPIPGAAANGYLAYIASISVVKIEERAVAVNTAPQSIPVTLSMLGLTTRIYAIVKNVVSPASSSVEMLVSISFSLKNRSIFAFIYINLRNIVLIYYSESSVINNSTFFYPVDDLAILGHPLLGISLLFAKTTHYFVKYYSNSIYKSTENMYNAKSVQCGIYAFIRGLIKVRRLVPGALRGAQVPHLKRTAGMEAEVLPIPSEVRIPMSMHIGAPANPVVNAGDEVKVGQVIGEPSGFVSVPVHSSVSGKVKSINEYYGFTGQKDISITITSDGEQALYEGLSTPAVTNRSEFIDAVRNSGVVGLGGAGFPTAVKLTVKDSGTLDYIIINGAECEPYITSDTRTMIDDTEFVRDGIELLRRYFDTRIVIGIENNKPEPIENMRRIAEALQGVEVRVLPVMYPQGGEKVLIYNITGRIVPEGGLPLDVGVIVLNCTTVAAIARFISTGIPIVSKCVTIDGSAVGNPKNVIVPIGTSIIDILDYCGCRHDEIKKVLLGGPMMGVAVQNLDMPVLKNTNALIALTAKDAEPPLESACIRCGRCGRNCPMRLMALELERAFLMKKPEVLEHFKINLCMECGCCAYNCPARRPLVQSIKLGKIMLRDYKAALSAAREKKEEKAGESDE